VDSSTALHIAAFQGQNATARRLVELGASLTSVNKCRAAPPLVRRGARARRRGGRACDAAHAGSNNENALALAELGRWTGLADWLRARMGLPLQPRAEAEAEARDFAALKEAAADRLSSSLLQHLATQPPGSRPRAAPRALRRRRRRGRPCSGPSELRKKNNCGLLV
jgi:ankyrin repeat protein